MPITAAFTVSQSAINPAAVTITDTSTGSDGAISARRVYISDAYGNYLTGSGSITYDTWVYANPSITLSVLEEDTAANIRVDWVNAGGAVLYTLNNNYPLSEFGKQFLYYLVQLQGLKPGTYMDTNYVANMCQFWINIVGGNNAVTSGNDIAGAQNCYNRETQMRLNQFKFF